MQQADQTVLSLRPGGGRGRLGGGPRFVESSSSSSASSSSSSSFAFGSFSSDLPLLRPHGGVPPSLSLKVSPVLSLSLSSDLEFFRFKDTIFFFLVSFSRFGVFIRSSIWSFNYKLDLDLGTSFGGYLNLLFLFSLLKKIFFLVHKLMGFYL